MDKDMAFFWAIGVFVSGMVIGGFIMLYIQTDIQPTTWTNVASSTKISIPDLDCSESWHCWGSKNESDIPPSRDNEKEFEELWECNEFTYTDFTWECGYVDNKYHNNSINYFLGRTTDKREITCSGGKFTDSTNMSYEQIKCKESGGEVFRIYPPRKICSKEVLTRKAMED